MAKFATFGFHFFSTGTAKVFYRLNIEVSECMSSGTC